MLDPPPELLQEMTNAALHECRKARYRREQGNWWEEDESQYAEHTIRGWATWVAGKHGYECYGDLYGWLRKVQRILYKQRQTRGVDIYFVLDTENPLSSYFTKEMPQL